MKILFASDMSFNYIEHLPTVPYQFDIDGIKLLKGEKLDNFNVYIDELNGIIADDRRHRKMWDAWCARWGMGSVTELELVTSAKQNFS